MPVARALEPHEIQLALLDQRVCRMDDDVKAMKERLDYMTRLLVGILVSTTTAAVILALNLTLILRR